MYEKMQKPQREKGHSFDDKVTSSCRNETVMTRYVI